jgi:hypothetical protein
MNISRIINSVYPSNVNKNNQVQNANTTSNAAKKSNSMQKPDAISSATKKTGGDHYFEGKA